MKEKDIKRHDAFFKRLAKDMAENEYIINKYAYIRRMPARSGTVNGNDRPVYPNHVHRVTVKFKSAFKRELDKHLRKG